MIDIADCKVEALGVNGGVKVTHLPTGICVAAGTEISSNQNLKKALKIIEGRLK